MIAAAFTATYRDSISWNRRLAKEIEFADWHKYYKRLSCSLGVVGKKPGLFATGLKNHL